MQLRTTMHLFDVLDMLHWVITHSFHTDTVNVQYKNVPLVNYIYHLFKLILIHSIYAILLSGYVDSDVGFSTQLSMVRFPVWQ